MAASRDFDESLSASATPFGLMAGNFLAQYRTSQDRLNAISDVLSGENGQVLRSAVANWIVDSLIPPQRLVPANYTGWVPVVRDAMRYVAEHLSSSRLASKLLEQIDLPPRTRPETRLLKLISKVPGLQKLGQVLARNRHLSRPLRRALVHLENGIRDVRLEEIRKELHQQLGPRFSRYSVRLGRGFLSEASVSAVVRFSWIEPGTHIRQRGVFKVLKPYVPEFYAEDMSILQGLAEHFGSRLHSYGFSPEVLADTFTKVRRLLQHEVDFVGEQKALRRAHLLYRSMNNVRIPQVITYLCTPKITALTEESGSKVTSVTKPSSPWRRARIADQLLEALIIAPMFAPEDKAIFHADPHAGNLLYDLAHRQLVIVDWALTEELTREQRTHLALLFLYVGLRDAVSVTEQIRHLAQTAPGRKREAEVRWFVSQYLSDVRQGIPTAVDAMRLLEHLTVRGTHFPASLIMLSKVLFTLDGIFFDLGVSGQRLAIPLLRHLFRKASILGISVASPLRIRDWMALVSSSLLFPARLGVRLQKTALDHLLPQAHIA